MRKLLVLLLFPFISCTKDYHYIEVTSTTNKIEDTIFSIRMDKCPEGITTCFWVNYPNYKDTVRLPVSWFALNQYYFNDTLVIISRNQVIWTRNQFYNVVPIKF